MKKGLYFLLFSLFFSCNNNKTTKESNFEIEASSPKSGTIKISVDESFKPVIQEQLKIYHATYPNSNIIVSYKSEVECLKDFQNDSVKLVVVSKPLSTKEQEIYKNNLYYTPPSVKVAFDAVAAIVNIDNVDSLFTFSDLKKILSGEKDYTVILDGNNATSTVKFLQDSVLFGKDFGKNVVAVKGSDSVISIVKQRKKTIGFVGNSWVNNSYDIEQLENFKSIKLALIECVRLEERGYFAKASQASLQYGQYPLARPVYYILKENYLGLATGFANFLASERGQLIFRRSCLVPAKMSFNKRAAKL